MSKLALGDVHGVEKFLNLQVAGLQIREDLANEVHQALDFEGVALLLPFYDQSHADAVRSGRSVQDQGLLLGGEVRMGGVVSKSFNQARAS